MDETVIRKLGKDLFLMFSKDEDLMEVLEG